VTEPPAEILRRLRPIPTTLGPPTTTPRDVVGVRPDGTACRIEIEANQGGERHGEEGKGNAGSTSPVLLLFLSAGCLGCRDLWEGLSELHAGLGNAARLAVVTKDPGDEDPADIAALAGDAAARQDVEVVMSTAAYRHYRVGGPPFLVLAAPESVRTESVAWGVQLTLHTALAALKAAEG
jgi:hypothetical protein